MTCTSPLPSKDLPPEAQSLRLRFSYSTKDFNEARRQFRKDRVVDQVFFWVTRIVIGTLAVPLLLALTVGFGFQLFYTFFSSTPLDPQQRNGNIATFLTLAGMVAVGFCIHLVRRRRDRKLQQFMQVVDITPVGLIWHRAHSQTLIAWTFYRNVLETPNVFLLRTAEKGLAILPKRSFTTDELAAIRDAFHSHIHVPNSFPVDIASIAQ